MEFDLNYPTNLGKGRNIQRQADDDIDDGANDWHADMEEVNVIRGNGIHDKMSSAKKRKDRNELDDGFNIEGEGEGEGKVKADTDADADADGEKKREKQGEKERDGKIRKERSRHTEKERTRLSMELKIEIGKYARKYSAKKASDLYEVPKSNAHK
jgi:hypothetical protein